VNQGTLEREGRKSVRDGMARYGIPRGNAFGVAISTLRQHAKRLGRNHELALALWDTGQYEARMLAAFVGEPERLTTAQMDRWAKDFDNWAVCDHACFHLFDRSPHAWGRVEAWSGRREEFVKRAAFALLWGLTVHDKAASDAQFVHGLALIERAATDERHYVQKAANMALRATGKRKPALRAPALTVAQRLAESSSDAARWVGKDALRELSRLKSRS
jgi:3-methyladenine DNA glycosylase AlkD